MAEIKDKFRHIENMIKVVKIAIPRYEKKISWSYLKLVSLTYLSFHWERESIIKF